MSDTLDQKLRAIGKKKAEKAFAAAMDQFERSLPKWHFNMKFPGLKIVENDGTTPRAKPLEWRNIKREIEEVMLPELVSQYEQAEVDRFLEDFEALRSQVDALEASAQS